MNDITMNKQLGTKWFTFYTKIRPWLASIMFLTALIDFVQYIDIYMENFYLFLYFLMAIAQVVLAIIVTIKSNENYGDFVEFVKKVLIFETINIPYQQGVKQYLQSGLDFNYALFIFVILLVICYFTWYRLNVKYFEKRLMHEPVLEVHSVVTDVNNTQENMPETSNTRMVDTPIVEKQSENNSIYHPQTDCEQIAMAIPLISQHEISFCRICGSKLLEDSQYCHKCGTKVSININKE